MGPCNWTVSYAKCSNTAALDSLDEETRAAVERSATEYLNEWTGGRFGLCPTTVRPCRRGCAETTTTFSGRGPVAVGVSLTGLGGPLHGQIEYGIQTDYGCGGCAIDHCSCGSPATEVRLPGPVAEVLSVTIDGTPLDPSAYRVDNSVILVRQDGYAWPDCQDLSLPENAAGTWQVEYLRGYPIPEGGRIAAGVLAAEMAKSLCNDNDCQLPERVQSVTRGGVSMMLLDGFDNLDKGYTGIWLIDSWIASVNRPQARSSVRSVDVSVSPRRRTTWSAR